MQHERKKQCVCLIYILKLRGMTCLKYNTRARMYRISMRLIEKKLGEKQ